MKVKKLNLQSETFCCLQLKSAENIKLTGQEKALTLFRGARFEERSTSLD